MSQGFDVLPGGMIRSGRELRLGYELRLMKVARRNEHFNDPSTNAVVGFRIRLIVRPLKFLQSVVRSEREVELVEGGGRTLRIAICNFSDIHSNSLDN